jgi:2-C-methyl-D-erythritol 4-phosphate cytidylyltransferase
MELIERVIQAAEQYGAAIPVLRINETVKEVEGGQILRTIPRERLFLAQTPQAFRAGILKDAYSKITDKNVTDEAMLVELAGHMVHVVDGEPGNMKITTSFDIRIAECWI